MTNKERLDSLESRIHTLESNAGISSESDSSRTSKWAAWFPLAAGFATLLIGGITTAITLTIHFDNKIGAAQRDIQAMGVRVGKVEDSVKVLANQQSDQTQKLINNLLTAAQHANLVIATRATKTAAALTAILNAEKRPASPDFFARATHDLSALRTAIEPEIRTVAFQTQTGLAEYRSTLEPEQQIGTTFMCQSHAQTFAKSSTAGMGTFGKMTIVNCSQELDRIIWDNVVFINSTIIYKGGPMVLKNVIFVNCKFQVEKNDAGFGLLQYAALDERRLEIRS